MTPLLLSALLALAPCADARPDGWTWSPTPVPGGEEPPTPLLTPTPTEAPAAPSPLPGATWFDEGHALVAEGLLLAVSRLDRFFGDERQVDLPRSRSWFRWRNDLKLRDDGSASFTTSVRAELRFPSLDERLRALRLTVSGGTTDTLDQLLPAEPGTPDTPDQPSAGLKLFLLDTLRTQTDLSAGLLFRWPIGWYARLRLRHNLAVGDLLLARFAVAGFWQTPTGWGTRWDADFDRQLAPRLLLRLANTATVTEVSRGWEWASELSLLAAVGQRTALFLGGGPQGATRLGPSVEIWRVHARVRRDVLRRWLFLEVEPGVAWTRPPGGGRLRERSVILRLELQFDAALRPLRPEPPPSEPAPAVLAPPEAGPLDPAPPAG
jgi:hypothetical protein